jgi:hypothetical protein
MQVLKLGMGDAMRPQKSLNPKQPLKAAIRWGVIERVAVTSIFESRIVAVNIIKALKKCEFHGEIISFILI